MGSQIVFGVISAIVGIIGTAITVSQYYQRKHKETLQQFTEKRLEEYGMQRDIRHLQRHVEQLSFNQKTIAEEMDLRIDKLELQLRDLIGKLESLYAILNSQSRNN
jgi:TolA-binding protein